jgi:hypothetical protein
VRRVDGITKWAVNRAPIEINSKIGHLNLRNIFGFLERLIRLLRLDSKSWQFIRSRSDYSVMHWNGKPGWTRTAALYRVNSKTDNRSNKPSHPAEASY